MNDSKILVGDVGGTHARFAVVDTAKTPFGVETRADLGTEGYGNFAAALRAYLERIGTDPPKAAAIAVAGPVTDGRVHLTNSGWEISEEELLAAGFSRALLINDFAALAFSVTTLPETAFRSIGPELTGLPDQPITMLRKT